MNIDLSDYKEGTTYVGYDKGLNVRKLIKLDDVDNEEGRVVFTIPKLTTSFNPSFYIGLFLDSYKNLGLDKFNEKYGFDIQTSTKIRYILIKSLQDGERNCMAKIKNKKVMNGNTKKLDRVFLILLLIQFFIIFIMGNIESVTETMKTISFIGILLTMGVWYMLSLKNKRQSK